MNPNIFITVRSAIERSPVGSSIGSKFSGGQFVLNASTHRLEFQVVPEEHDPKRVVCACCVNKQRSQVRGAKAKKIFQKGIGHKSV